MLFHLEDYYNNLNPEPVPSKAVLRPRLGFLSIDSPS